MLKLLHLTNSTLTATYSDDLPYTIYSTVHTLISRIGIQLSSKLTALIIELYAHLEFLRWCLRNMGTLWCPEDGGVLRPKCQPKCFVEGGGGRGWPHKSFVSVYLSGYYNWSGFVLTEAVILDILEDGVKYCHMLTLSSRAVPNECSLTHINTRLEYHLPSKMGFL